MTRGTLGKARWCRILLAINAATGVVRSIAALQWSKIGLLLKLNTAFVPQGSAENRPSGVTSKPANGVAQDVILSIPLSPDQASLF